MTLVLVIFAIVGVLWLLIIARADATVRRKLAELRQLADDEERVRKGNGKKRS